MEQAPDEPAKGYYKGEVDRVPSISPIEHKPLDQTKDPIRSRPKHVIVVLREEGVADLASSLQTFAPNGSTITVISKEKPEVTDAALHCLAIAAASGQAAPPHLCAHVVCIPAIHCVHFTSCPRAPCILLLWHLSSAGWDAGPPNSALLLSDRSLTDHKMVDDVFEPEQDR